MGLSPKKIDDGFNNCAGDPEGCVAAFEMQKEAALSYEKNQIEQEKGRRKLERKRYCVT